MTDPELFFATLYKDVPKEYYAELRLIPESTEDKKPIRLYRPAHLIHTGDFQVLAELNTHYHIYHRVALSLEQRSRKQDISLVTALWMDIDGKTNEIYQKIEDHHYPPTILINSGGGWHLYWLLKAPLILANDKDRAEVERTIQGLILDFGETSDKHVKDCTRILRTPSFFNIKAKYAPNFPQCKIHWLDDSAGYRYHFHHLHRRYAHLGAPQSPQIRRELPVINSSDRPKWIVDYLASGVGEGSRNQRLFVVARYFHDMGDNSASTEQELIARGMADGLSHQEALTAIRSAWSQARNPSNTIEFKMKSRYIIGDVARKDEKK